MKNKKLHKIIGILGIIFSVLLGVVGTLLAFSAKWMFKTWTNLSMDELVFHLTAPLEGTNTDMIKDYCNECVVPVVLILSCMIFLICANRKNKKKVKENSTCFLYRSNCNHRRYSRGNMERTGYWKLFKRAGYIFYIYR